MNNIDNNGEVEEKKTVKDHVRDYRSLEIRVKDLEGWTIDQEPCYSTILSIIISNKLKIVTIR